MYEEILTVLGLCYLGKLTVSLTWSAVQGFRAHILSRILPSPSISDTYGRWAGTNFFLLFGRLSKALLGNLSFFIKFFLYVSFTLLQ